MNQEPNSVFDEINRKRNELNNWLRSSVMVRLFVIGFLVMIMLVPLEMVRELIHERERTQLGAVEEISSKWGRQQTIKGPVLTVPYYVYSKVYKDKDEDKFELVKYKRYAHFLPEKLIFNGNVKTEARYRGIYEVILYNSAMELTGSFTSPDFSELGVEDRDILWNEAFIAAGISDLRSVQENIEIDWNKNKYAFNPGVPSSDVIEAGISTKVPVSKVKGTTYNFEIKMDFNGSSSLNFIPLGKETNVKLISDWKHPSFTGSFLPDNRQINEEGFEASWKVLNLNRSFPQSFSGKTTGVDESSFGVSLLQPVNEYQKSIRSVKYGILTIMLTFMAFFIIQVLKKELIHPVQYILVGFALTIFYTLLISLSEHIGFNLAYLASSLAIITLVTIYTTGIFRNYSFSLLISTILAVLYLFIFVIIQLQDYSLLVGSLGLFAILSGIMILTRKINWYEIEKVRLN